MDRIRTSWLFLILGAFVGVYLVKTGQDDGAPGATLFAAAYAVWALYWGAPPFWRWWRGASVPFANGLLGGGLMGWTLRKSFSWSFLLVGSYCYSVFGGGPYQFLKHLWVSRRHA